MSQEIKERPMLFNGDMVRAVLSGQKTVTRRIAKPVKHPDLGNIYTPGALVLENEPQHVIDRACPYGQPGERLWVRETHFVNGDGEDSPVVYRADQLPDWEGEECEIRWSPSIHMPRWASRILLEITSVRVERLQDISEEQIQAEGIGGHEFGCRQPYDQDGAPLCDCGSISYEESFQRLWNSTGGDWNANPWVWVVEFKRVTP